jgi:hypothetical protein
MWSVRAAEWILSLTTTSERASAAAGDLAEGAATRGWLWFWLSLARATASFVFRAWADHPLRIAALVFGAYLLQLVFFQVTLMVMFVGEILAVVFTKLSESSPDPTTSYVVVQLITFAANLLCTFQVGRWVTRRAPSLELAVCVSFAAVHCFFPTIISLNAPALPPHALTSTRSLLLASDLAALLLGVARMRKQLLTSSTNLYAQS